MTGDTLGSNDSYFFVRGCRFGMAFLARHVAMCPLQRECSLFVVIERHQHPGPYVMTGLALHAKGLLVFVVFLMTAKAVPRGILVAMGFVTALARQEQMASCQRKPCAGVVEIRSLPGLVVVTGPALGT